jgi:hypothetical protein
MGVINVEGIGAIQIAGDTPTAEEQKAILNASAAKGQDTAESSVTDFLKSKEFKRLVLETGLAMGGAYLTGGATLPAVAARAGMLSRPFLSALARSSAGSAAGGAYGAAGAQAFDPKDDMLKEIIRGGTEGALQEAIGAPLGVKAGQYLEKVVRPKVQLIEGAQEAERSLAAQAAKIKEAPAGAYSKGVTEAADKYGLTLGVKAENRFLDTLENITEKSLFGAGSLIQKKEGAKLVGESALEDYLKSFITTEDKTATGKLFNSAISNSEDLWKARMQGNYKAIDSMLKQHADDLWKARQAELSTALNQPSAVAKEVVTGQPIVNPIKDMNPLADKIVDMTGFKSALAKIKEELPIGGASAPNVVKFVDNYIANTPNKIGFAEANSLRSDILAEGRKIIAKEDSAKIKGASKTAGEEITAALDRTTKDPSFPKELKELYYATQEEYRLGKADFNDQIIKKILTKYDPSDIYQTIVSRGDKPETIKKTLDIIERRIAKEPGSELIAQDLKDSLKGQFLNNALKDSRVVNEQYGSFISAKKLRSGLDNYTGTMKELFTEQERANIDSLIKTLGITQGNIAKGGGLGGGLFIQFKQSGALASVLQLGGGVYSGATGSPGTAATILLGPAVLSKVMLNPKFNKYLIEGFKAKTYPQASLAFGKLAGKMSAEGLIDQETNNDIQQQIKQGPTNKAPVNKAPIPVSQLAQPRAQAPTQPQVNMFAANPQAQTPSAQVQAPQGQSNNFTNIPQDQLNKYSTLFGKVV